MKHTKPKDYLKAYLKIYWAVGNKKEVDSINEYRQGNALSIPNFAFLRMQYIESLKMIS